MSGEKAHRARVVSAEELHRRDVAAAQARCLALRDQLAALAARVEGDVRSPRNTRLEDLGRLQSTERDLHFAIRDAKAALSLQQSRARLELVATTLPSEATREVTLGLAVPASTTPSQEKLGRLLSRLAEVESQVVLEAIARRVSSAASLPEPQLQRALLELNHEVTGEVKRQRVRDRCRTDAEAEALKIAHVDGELADELRERAQAVVDQSALTSLRTDVQMLLQEAEREANAAFITRQAMLVMEELGYAVDEPFELVERHSDGFLARREDLPTHALQVSVDPAAGVLQTRMVAIGDTSAADDLRAESATCGDALALAQRLSSHGVEAETVFHRAPGELPVPKTPKAAPRRRKRAQLKEMELNR